MKIFGRNIRHSPEETAEARAKAIAGGLVPRRAAKIRAYIITTEYDRFEKYWIARGFFGVVAMHIVLGLGYVLMRLKHKR
jgi:hypothetical protein